MDRQSSASFLADLGLLLMRLMIAAVFLFQGSQKIFGVFGGRGMEDFAQGLESMNVPMPVVSAWAAALATNGRLGVVERDGPVGKACLHVRSPEGVGRRDLFDCFPPVMTGFEPNRGFAF